MPDEARSLKDYLAIKHTVYGWERAAIWLLLAACLGLDATGGPDASDVADTVRSFLAEK